MVQHFANLRRELPSRFHMHRPKPGGRLNRRERDRGAPEGARALKSANVGQNACATPRVEPSHSKGAAQLSVAPAPRSACVSFVTR
jgi:hypothetical protein